MRKRTIEWLHCGVTRIKRLAADCPLLLLIREEVQTADELELVRVGEGQGLTGRLSDRKELHVERLVVSLSPRLGAELSGDNLTGYEAHATGSASLIQGCLVPIEQVISGLIL